MFYDFFNVFLSGLSFCFYMRFYIFISKVWGIKSSSFVFLGFDFVLVLIFVGFKLNIGLGGRI